MSVVLANMWQFYVQYTRIPSDVWCPFHKTVTTCTVASTGVAMACGDWLVDWSKWPYAQPTPVPGPPSSR